MMMMTRPLLQRHIRIIIIVIIVSRIIGVFNEEVTRIDQTISYYYSLFTTRTTIVLFETIVTRM
jgi:hypothetical protein